AERFGEVEPEDTAENHRCDVNHHALVKWLNLIKEEFLAAFLDGGSETIGVEPKLIVLHRLIEGRGIAGVARGGNRPEAFEGGVKRRGTGQAFACGCPGASRLPGPGGDGSDVTQSLRALATFEEARRLTEIGAVDELNIVRTKVVFQASVENNALIEVHQVALEWGALFLGV